MTRHEFLDELRIALQGNVDNRTLNENIAYYEEYIIKESKKGRTEEEVIESLGNPRLLAKTVIDSTPNAGDMYYTEESYDNGSEQDEEYTFRTNNRVYTGWKAKAAGIATIIGVVAVLIGIISLIMGVISILAPIIIPILVIVLVVRLLSRR